MATRDSNVTSDESLYIKCCVCIQENRKREAEKYCVQCKDYFCSTCVGVHTKIPLLRGHTLLDKADFKTFEPHGSLPSFPTERCRLHPSEAISIYCKNHDEVACPVCVALYHRGCNDVHSISDEIDNLYKDTDLTLVKKKISTSRRCLEQLRKTTEAKVNNLETSRKEAEMAVKAFKGEIESLLNDLEQRTLNEIKEKFTRIKTSLSESIREIDMMITSLDDVQKQVNEATGNRAQEFVSKKMSERVTAKGEQLENDQVEKNNETVLFVPNFGLKASLTVFSKLGEVFLPKPTLYQIRKSTEIYMKYSKNRQDCLLYDLCILNDDYVLVTDVTSKRLRRVCMSTNKVKDSIRFWAHPIGVCQVSTTRGAVTLNNKTIQLIAIKDKMSLSGSLTMNHHCAGLVHVRGRLFISDDADTVYIYDMYGQQLKTVSVNNALVDIVEDHGDGYTYYASRYFTMTRSIAVSAAGDKVHVADLGRGLVTLDIEGNHISTLKDIQLHGCSGVCTDGRNFFVCGYYSDAIIQIGPDNKVLGKIATVTNPHSIVFDHKKNRLIVTKGRSNSITVLELSKLLV